MSGIRMSAPIALGSTFVAPGHRPITITGTDYISTTNIIQSSPDGLILASIPLTPANLGSGTHLASMAMNYERYRFNRLSFKVVSRVPTTTGGGYLAGMTPDPFQELFPGPGAKRAVRAYEGSVSAPLWQSTSVRTKIDNFLRYTDLSRDLPLLSAGKFFVVLDGTPSLASATDVVQLSIEIAWSVTFTSPTVPEVISGVIKIPPLTTTSKVGLSVDQAYYTVKGQPLVLGLTTASSGPWQNAFLGMHFDGVYRMSSSLHRNTFEPPGEYEYIRLFNDGSATPAARFKFYPNYAAASASDPTVSDGANGALPVDHGAVMNPNLWLQQTTEL